jgi:hypothetical protein
MLGMLSEKEKLVLAISSLRLNTRMCVRYLKRARSEDMESVKIFFY